MPPAPGLEPVEPPVAAEGEADDDQDPDGADSQHRTTPPQPSRALHETTASAISPAREPEGEVQASPSSSPPASARAAGAPGRGRRGARPADPPGRTPAKKASGLVATHTARGRAPGTAPRRGRRLVGDRPTVTSTAGTARAPPAMHRAAAQPVQPADPVEHAKATGARRVARHVRRPLPRRADGHRVDEGRQELPIEPPADVGEVLVLARHGLGEPSPAAGHRERDRPAARAHGRRAARATAGGGRAVAPQHAGGRDGEGQQDAGGPPGGSTAGQHQAAAQMEVGRRRQDPPCARPTSQTNSTPRPRGRATSPTRGARAPAAGDRVGLRGRACARRGGMCRGF